MNLYIKRSWTGTFEKGLIEFDDIEVWTALTRGFEERIKNTENLIDIYSKKGNLDEIKKLESKLQKYQGYLEMLNVKNELNLNTFSIKKKRIDHHFNEDLRNLSDEEILNKINRLFPEEKFHIIPSFRDTVVNRFMTPGRTKNYLFTYDRDLKDDISK